MINVIGGVNKDLLLVGAAGRELAMLVVEIEEAVLPIEAVKMRLTSRCSTHGVLFN